ncbi:ElyC/SanA/YdcF family protein [Thalassotalea sp. G2M2-11]|uniref:ElyC/SanA/YdcF family protein n=1 Tax=Thalassotalea sp. G2M2-11 TaxID=2787627 RepID=UPI0019D25EED|nr:ElyC/SanA/YdcF family protein [Thalassotalea sp. G2M2-11]
MDLFLLKKILGFVIMPLSIISLLLICALLLFSTRPKVSFKCLLTATAILLLSSTGWVADRLILPLEKQYPAYTNQLTQVDYIIVLGCGHVSDNAIPATEQLFTCSLERLVEALRIFKLHPEAQIITSGAAFSNQESNAEKVKQAAVLLGIPEHKIMVESFPKDTEEEAELIAPRVIGRNVILITNADHMPRAVNYFQQQGVSVTPAPASFYVKDFNGDKNWSYYLPQSSNLVQTTTAWYETIGLFVQWLKSWW